MKETIFIRHFRKSWFHTNDNTYEMTFAAKVVDGIVSIGVAVCSKNDQFDKREGRRHAIERLTYDPTFTFPALHKKDVLSAHYWFTRLVSGANNDGNKEIKDFVARKQRAFDLTENGIQLRMQHDKEAYEAEQARVEAKKAYREKAATKRREAQPPT